MALLPLIQNPSHHREASSRERKRSTRLTLLTTATLVDSSITPAIRTLKTSRYRENSEEEVVVNVYFDICFFCRSW